MITAILSTRDDEMGLALALSALVPAATEGIRQIGRSDGPDTRDFVRMDTVQGRFEMGHGASPG